MDGGPKVERVAVSSAFEAMKGIVVDIDGKASCGASRRGMQRTGAAPLRSSFHSELKAE